MENNRRAWLERAASNAVPSPADFPLGSEQSRAAARAIVEARTSVSEAASESRPRILVIYETAGYMRTPEFDAVVDALQECGYLRDTFHCIHVEDVMSKVPSGLDMEALKTYVRKHCAEILSKRDSIPRP